MREQRELELKFDVSTDWIFPDVSDLVPVGGSVEVQTVALTSTYYDTAQHDLLENRLTLRQRTGDTDQGWHLKIPEHGARTEVRVPLGRGRTVPKPLQQIVLGVRAGSALAPIAKLHTERTIHRIVNPAGAVLAEIADDQVTATALGESAVISEWREVEVELVDGDMRFLKKAARILHDAGAPRSAGTSKLARALGGTEPVGAPAADSSLHALVRSYLSEQYDAIVRGDIDLRRGRAVIHPTRVGTRRFRSVLRVFADQFDAARASALDDELKWYAELLGTVRDRQVLRAHLDELVHSLPPDMVMGPVTTRIDQALTREEQLATVALQRGMAGERYLTLMRELRSWHDRPPLIGDDRCAEDVSKYMQMAERKVDKRLARASRAAAHAPALHSARKAGKRARYIAELAEPALGKPASKLVERARKLQDLLGGLQDSVVAEEFVRRMGAEAGATPGENGFTFGILWAREQERAQRAMSRAGKALH